MNTPIDIQILDAKMAIEDALNTAINGVDCPLSIKYMVLKEWSKEACAEIIKIINQEKADYEKAKKEEDAENNTEQVHSEENTNVN